MAGLTFYDDAVREGLEELAADGEYQERLWMGLVQGQVSSPTECLMTIFEDSGLKATLTAGSAYGEPTDELLRQIDALTDHLDVHRPMEELEQDARFTTARQLAGEALASLEGRPLGSVRGDKLDSP